LERYSVDLREWRCGNSNEGPGKNLPVPLDTVVGEAYQGRHPGRPTRSTPASV
jgi:hypothetical protein